MILLIILTMLTIKLNKRFLLYLIFSIFSIELLFAKPIKFEGLSRLSQNDLQALTDYQLSDDNFTNKSVNEIARVEGYIDWKKTENRNVIENVLSR